MQQLGLNIRNWNNIGSMFAFRNCVLQAQSIQQGLPQTVQFCYTGETLDITFDSQGYPNSLTGPHAVYGSQTATISIGDGNSTVNMPAGTYTLGIKEGAGWIGVEQTYLDGTGNTTWYDFSAGPTTHAVTLGKNSDLTVQNCQLVLAETPADNHMTGVFFFMPNPAYATSSAPSTTPYSYTDFSSIWHDTFLKETRVGTTPMSLFRPMELLSTNSNTIQNFSDYPSCDSNLQPTGLYTYGCGVPFPLAVLLNLMHTLNPSADLWFNIPTQATDACVTSIAEYLQANFPNKVYFEYSNEVWNSGFPQYNYAIAQGEAVFPGQTTNPYQYNRWFYQYRSKQVHDLGRAAFASDANPSRFKPLLSTVTYPYGGDSTPNKYTTTGTTYSSAIAPIFITNSYYGNAYYSSSAAISNTIATGVSAILTDWGPTGATLIGPGWYGTNQCALYYDTTWVVYEGNFDTGGANSCNTGNGVLEQQSITIPNPAPTGGSFTLTMPFSQSLDQIQISPAQPLGPNIADSTSSAIAWNATPLQIREAIGAITGITNSTGIAVDIATTNTGGVSAQIAAGDVITITFGSDTIDYPTSPTEYGGAPYCYIPLPLLEVNDALTGGGGAPTITRVAAGRQSDNYLMYTLIRLAMLDSSNEVNITSIFRYTDYEQCQAFCFFGSVNSDIWGPKLYQGAPDNSEPVYLGLQDYLDNPSAYPAEDLPPPAAYLTGLSFSVATAYAGQVVTATVTINAAQSSSTSISLTSNHPELFSSFPSTITVPEGETTGTATIVVANSFASTTVVTGTAQLSYIPEEAEVTLVPFSPSFQLNMSDSRASACVAFYPFNESSGSKLYDNGPNSLHLTIQGTENTDYFRAAGPGTGTSGVGQYCLYQTTGNGGYSLTPNSYGGPLGVTLHQNSFAYMIEVLNTGNSDFDDAIIGWFTSSGLYGVLGKENPTIYGLQMQDPAWSSYNGGTNTYPHYSQQITNADTSDWLLCGLSVGTATADYRIGSVNESISLPADPTDSIACYGVLGINYIAHPATVKVSTFAVFNRALTDTELQTPLSNLIEPVVVAPVATIGHAKRYLARRTSHRKPGIRVFGSR